MILGELVNGLVSGSSAAFTETRSVAPLFEDLGQLTPDTSPLTNSASTIS
jgi:hypothetical protein